MRNVSQPVSAKWEPPRNFPGVGRRLNHALGAFVWEATCLYRIGGFMGIVFGVSAAVLSYQIRRMGR